jgi:hypothetical protein
MEPKVNAWKSNLNNGLIMGLVGIVYSLILYFLDLSLNKSAGYVFILIQIGLLFFLLKSYRDNVMHGQITYGQSVGAGVIICLYYGIMMAIFSYILFTVIDPGLVTKQLAIAEEGMAKRGMPQAQIDAGMAITTKMMKPVFMAIWGLFFSVLWGLLLSLVIAIFIKKEGNPLIDTPEN